MRLPSLLYVQKRFIVCSASYGGNESHIKQFRDAVKNNNTETMTEYYPKVNSYVKYLGLLDSIKNNNISHVEMLLKDTKDVNVKIHLLCDDDINHYELGDSALSFCIKHYNKSHLLDTSNPYKNILWILAHKRLEEHVKELDTIFDLIHKIEDNEKII
jgi:hypothetical protein